MLAYILAVMVGGFTLWSTFFITGILAAFAFGDLAAGYIGMFVAGSFGGAAFGLMNWFLLRGRASGARQWVLVNASGWALGMLTLAIVWNSFHDFPKGLAFGLSVGSLQWLVLRRQFQQAMLWIVANTVVWAIGTGMTFAIPYGLFLAGSMASLILGLIMLWFVRHPVEHSDQSTSSVLSA
jgi:hypothetical protein